jgi:hypothetical protein
MSILCHSARLRQHTLDGELLFQLELIRLGFSVEGQIDSHVLEILRLFRVQ